MSKLKGKLLKYGDLWYFMAEGYSRPMFYSTINQMWIISNGGGFSEYWHRHVIGYVSIDKVMVK